MDGESPLEALPRAPCCPWREPLLCSLSYFLKFSFYSSPLGLPFFFTATTIATSGRDGLVAAFTGRWKSWDASSTARSRGRGLVRAAHCCHFLSAPRALHASTGRARFLALLTGRCSLLHRELHRELGLVAVELAVLTGWHGRLHREERRGSREGEGCMALVHFCFLS
ncbi:hypothetical protein ACOSQ2_013248 [Xanthoceras sorbifolium]